MHAENGALREVFVMHVHVSTRTELYNRDNVYASLIVLMVGRSIIFKERLLSIDFGTLLAAYHSVSHLEDFIMFDLMFEDRQMLVPNKCTATKMGPLF